MIQERIILEAKRLLLYTDKSDELVEIYNDFHKLETYNGLATNELPVPATYVIGTDGAIRYAFVDTDYRKRSEPADILNALTML